MKASRKIRTLTAGAAASLVLGVGATLLTVGPAAAAGCGATLNPKTSGAEAFWEVKCVGTQRVGIAGWVKDTDNDGQCARVKATFPNGTTYYSPQACPKGTKVNFSSGWRSGALVDAYLYEFDV
ncbi:MULTISPECIES: hypothetical protein [Streptomyces]|uniref:hypothetical protein n=1 Tax=Streptomyces TaxID=1883 RepID=UPI001885892B|nr:MULTISPECIES: hypothetical protein [Streptomyces]MCM8551853.1 hypothetical protein [Streptomyces sp. STCH 565 A]